MYNYLLFYQINYGGVAEECESEMRKSSVETCKKKKKGIKKNTKLKIPIQIQPFDLLIH